MITVRKEGRDGGKRCIPEGDRHGVGDAEWRVKTMRDRQARDRSGGESEREGDGRNKCTRIRIRERKVDVHAGPDTCQNKKRNASKSFSWIRSKFLCEP